MVKKTSGTLLSQEKTIKTGKRACSGQSIVLAIITITFMAGIGYALIMWSRAQSRQAVQKEQHGSAEEIGKACVDQAIYEIMHGIGSGYTWGEGVGVGFDDAGFTVSGDSWAVLTVHLADGSEVNVQLNQIGELVEP
ncbi:MAG: hypothetical protein U9O97_05095 [Elusimicrobiota bacterium]|nr:hypothetical protein [Elusimicrobiota bacterium]